MSGYITEIWIDHDGRGTGYTARIKKRNTAA